MEDWRSLNFWQTSWGLYRQDAFEHLAWAQWTVGEIKHGKPFRWLLEV